MMDRRLLEGYNVNCYSEGVWRGFGVGPVGAEAGPGGSGGGLKGSRRLDWKWRSAFRNLLGASFLADGYGHTGPSCEGTWRSFFSLHVLDITLTSVNAKNACSLTLQACELQHICLAPPPCVFSNTCCIGT